MIFVVWSLANRKVDIDCGSILFSINSVRQTERFGWRYCYDIEGGGMIRELWDEKRGSLSAWINHHISQHAPIKLPTRRQNSKRIPWVLSQDKKGYKKRTAAAWMNQQQYWSSLKRERLTQDQDLYAAGWGAAMQCIKLYGLRRHSKKAELKELEHSHPT